MSDSKHTLSNMDDNSSEMVRGGCSQYSGRPKTKMADKNFIYTGVLYVVLVLSKYPTGNALSDNPVKPKTYTVNLDEPPETRWNQVLEDFKFMVPELTKTVQ